MRKNILTTDISSIQKYVDAHGSMEEVGKETRLKAVVLSSGMFSLIDDWDVEDLKPLHEYNFKVYFSSKEYSSRGNFEEHICTVTPNYELRPKNTRAFLKHVTKEIYLVAQIIKNKGGINGN